MLIKELIGKTITNIFQVLNYEHGGLDSGECFVELDHTLIIDIPYSFDNFEDEVHIKNLNPNAVTVFTDLDKLYPVYHVNKEGKSIQEIVDKYAANKPITEYEPYKVEYVENKLKYIKDRTIKDLIKFGDDDEKYFFELDNGYLISETNFSPNGTGRIGINLYENLDDVISWKGNDFKRYQGS